MGDMFMAGIVLCIFAVVVNVAVLVGVVWLVVTVLRSMGVL